MLKRFGLVLALLSGVAFAEFCPGEWEVRGEFLYLFPMVDDTYFVVDSSSSSVPIGKRENNDFGFQPGFRVGGTYAFCDCCRLLDVNYTRLGADEKRTVAGEALWPTVGSPDVLIPFIGNPGFATSDLDLLYQRVDGTIVQRGSSVCCVDLWFEGGVEYAYLRLHEQYTYLIPPVARGEVDLKSQVWGVGPQIGFRGRRHLCNFSCCCPGSFSLTGRTSGSLLVSKSEEKERMTFNGATLNDMHDDETWRIIPAWHARLGLEYAWCGSCWNGALEIGYQFDVYCHGLARIIIPDDAAESMSFNNYTNFSLQGLYVSASFNF